jgi:hypothetical protein
MKQKTSKVNPDQVTIKKQRSLLERYKHQDTRLKWALGGAGALIVLLLLLLGFATDWTTGLRKDKTTKDGTPISSNLDALRSQNGTGTNGDGSGTGSTGGTGGNGGSSTTPGSNTSTTTNTTTPGSSTTTTNNSTTTNNTTTTNPPSTPQPSGLLSLYANSSVGDSINDILTRGSLLGISGQCHTDILIQVCDFVDGDATVTIKNLLGTGLVTSITKNF